MTWDQPTAIAVIMAIFVIGVRIVRRRQAARATANGLTFKGFSGWLLILLLYQILYPIRLLSSAIVTTDLVSNFVFQPHAELALDIAIAAFAMLVAYSIVVGVMMWRRSKLFPLLFTVQAVAMVAVGGVIPGLLATLVGLPFSFGYAATDMSVLVQIVTGLLWTVYVWRSARVRAMFVRGKGYVPPPHVDPAIFS